MNPLIVTPISQDDRKLCDDPITLQENTFAIEHCKTNKSPGVDGLSAEFFQAFTQDLAPFLLEVILESVEKGSLPPSLTQGLIMLNPKRIHCLLIIGNLFHY